MSSDRLLGIDIGTCQTTLIATQPSDPIPSDTLRYQKREWHSLLKARGDMVRPYTNGIYLVEYSRPLVEVQFSETCLEWPGRLLENCMLQME